MPSFTPDEHRHMQRALALAARGHGFVEPNPMVGCVLVRGRRVIGEGYHRRYGGPHAEVDALRRCREPARGATAYVSLEPCCHFGKTPPCTNALIEAGVRRVVAAMADPFPKVRGKGVRQLRAAGVAVEIGLLEAEARRLNAPYLKRQRTGRPWVILKWAQSIDGKIGTRTGDSKWISSDASRRLVHRVRGQLDAIIVGVGTVVADDPLLTCREGRPRRIATRIVIDPHLRTPPGTQLVRTANHVPTLLLTDQRAATGKKAAGFKASGVEILGVRFGRRGLDLGALLDELGHRGMTNVMVEGGGHTLGAFYDQQLMDEGLVFVSSRLIGGQAAPSALAGDGPANMADVRAPSMIKVARSGSDLLYRMRWTAEG